MEKHPELVNSPGTPSYDENAERLLELWGNGSPLEPDEMGMLCEAYPDLAEETDFFGEDMYAA